MSVHPLQVSLRFPLLAKPLTKTFLPTIHRTLGYVFPIHWFLSLFAQQILERPHGEVLTEVGQGHSREGTCPCAGGVQEAGMGGEQCCSRPWGVGVRWPQEGGEAQRVGPGSPVAGYLQGCRGWRPIGWGDDRLSWLEIQGPLHTP